MPSQQTVDAFVSLVTEGHYVEAMERFYADDACARENQGDPRIGLAALIANERRVLAAHVSIEAGCIPPIMIADDHVAIHWRFTFTAPDGHKTKLDEIAWQRWEGERMKDEQFFYDPSQMRPPK